jgi:hypothetical protein
MVTIFRLPVLFLKGLQRGLIFFKKRFCLIDWLSVFYAHPAEWIDEMVELFKRFSIPSVNFY